ncbi:MAG: hypothetical protein JNL10_15365 [Verrucomicrobiales bacterium]|nr:hypothetical protein [Verrucomicrobiales bacterium]
MSRELFPKGGLLRWGVGPSLVAAALTQWGVSADPTVLYESRFERIEGFSADEDLMGQGNWVGEATDLNGQRTLAGGNGVLDEPVPGFEGQYAYIGYDAPSKTADFNVWRPINLKPAGQPLPVIRFEVSFQINDSTAAAPYFDDFRWSVYNASNQRLFSLDFDNEDLGVNYILDDQRGTTPPPIVPTGFQFAHVEPYDLQIDLNLQRNLWTARINGVTVVSALPITSVGAPLTLGDVDAVWVIRTPGKPGDNYMIFDDYRISVLDISEIPPSVEAVGMLNSGAFVVRVLGEPGVTYRLEAATLAASGSPGWEIVNSGVAQSPGGYVDLQDPGAALHASRTYRAVSIR